MKTIFFSFLVLLFVSCEKVEDDSNLVCTEGCSSITGKAYTHSGIPVKNVLFKFRYQKLGEQNITLTRMISKERTDKLGQFNMSFYVEDAELGINEGHFDLYPQKNTIPGNVFYPDYFSLFSEQFAIENRDFAMQGNLYLPTPKKVKIKINNFQPIVQDDYVRIIARIPCGFDRETIDPETGNNHNYGDSDPNKHVLHNSDNVTSKTFEVELALNELNYIVIGRMKNMVYTEEITPINVNENSNQVLEYSY